MNPEDLCDDCGRPLDPDSILAIEFYAGEFDEKPIAHSVGENQICPFCQPNNAAIIRYMWPLISFRCDVTPADISHMKVVRHSGHRSHPITMFSVFPFADKPIKVCPK